MELNGTRFGRWDDRERLVVTVHAGWRELEPHLAPPSAGQLFALMAADFAARRS